MAYFRNLTHPHVRSYQFGMGLSGRKTGQKTGRKTCADRVEVPNKCSKLYHEGNTLGKIVHQLVIRPQQQPWTNKQSPTITTSISNGKQASTAINNNEQPWFILRQRWSFPNFVNTTDYPMTHLSLGFFKYKDTTSSQANIIYVLLPDTWSHRVSLSGNLKSLLLSFLHL